MKEPIAKPKTTENRIITIGDFDIIEPSVHSKIADLNNRFTALKTGLPKQVKCEHTAYSGIHRFVIEWEKPSKCPTAVLLSGKVAKAIKSALDGINYKIMSFTSIDNEQNPIISASR